MCRCLTAPILLLLLVKKNDFFFTLLLLAVVTTNNYLLPSYLRGLVEWHSLARAPSQILR